MFAKLLLDHPRSIGESYFGHMKFAGWFAGKLLQAAGAAAVHAVIPALFERTASQVVSELYERTQKRVQG